MLGILLINKPLGLSSHDVINRVRRTLGLKRVGHAGTLDPLATGVLVVAVGPATRFLQYLPLEPKEYVAEIKFGNSTTTQDAEGELSEARSVPEDLQSRINENLPQFLGLIQQLPPIYSAVKKHGKPLYAYARQGEEVEREPRTVHISSAKVLEIGADTATVKIVCSGGTYIRTWANDLGEALGCGAYLAGLKRTSVGRFDLSQTLTLDEVSESRLIPLSEALSPPTQLVQLSAEETVAIRQGRVVSQPIERQGLYGLLDPQGNVIGMANGTGNALQPECVIPFEAIL